MKRISQLIDGGIRMLDQDRIVRNSGYFDSDWYVHTYPEVGDPSLALAHFLREGTARGHDPGPGFSTAAYLAANPDVREAGYNALLHYLRFGRKEGRCTPDPVTGGEVPLGGAAMKRIAEAFDPAFYGATNPDLSGGEATLEHFLGVGWQQGRDPCPWFSVCYYLARHGDVAETGKNPFVHYLLWGAREGRDIQTSKSQTFEPATETAFGPCRLAALTMVRNEADIIRAFASHVLALFDDVVFVDHMSDDGTDGFLRALARENRRVHVLTLDEPAYIQSVTMTHMVRSASVLNEADWVFLLDADEFLPFPDRPAFEAALAGYARCPVIDMRWQNLIPETYWSREVTLTPEARFITSPELSPFRKVAFQPGRISLARTHVAQGNHALTETKNGLDVPSFEADFPLLHLPVRSPDQLVLKLNQGVEAYRQMGRSRDSAHGTHWDQMMRATAGRELSPSLLNAVVERYSEDKTSLEPVTKEELLSAGHKVRTLELAMADIGVGPVQARSLGEMLMRIHGTPAPERETPDCPSTTCLETTGDRLRRAEGDPGADYGPLPPTEVEPVGSNPTLALEAFFAPSYRAIDDLVPSSKAGHIPFLFSLVEFVRPRRLVEVGTLRGAGFLAACQAARQGGHDMEAVAVSGWSVSDDPGYHDAFDVFTFLARKYADFAGYLRLSTDKAIGKFADGAIDLLLIDGYCEAERLRHDMDLWMPKLSDQGVLLLHDTNAHGGEFGVWRVWEDLGDRYPTLDFAHSEGLGLACIGPNVAPQLVALCEMVREDCHARRMIRHHFEKLGEMSAELFSRRYDMARNEVNVQAEAAQSEELSWLRQELECQRSDNAQLRGLLSGSIGDAVTRTA